ncbi:MAG: hypothetical protein ACYDAQ_04495 [Mycobacteriales bacterium]
MTEPTWAASRNGTRLVALAATLAALSAFASCGAEPTSTPTRLGAGASPTASYPDPAQKNAAIQQARASAPPGEDIGLPVLLGGGAAWAFAGPQQSIVYTSNYGASWTPVASLPALRAQLPPGEWVFDAAQFLDASHAWVGFATTSGGEEAELLSTVDGGSHWTPISLPAAEVPELRYNYARVSQIHFTTPTTGWVVLGSGDRLCALQEAVLLTTTDGGSSWVSHPLPTPCGSAYFAGASRAWYVRTGGFGAPVAAGGGAVGHLLWTSDDGGNTWAPAAVSPAACATSGYLDHALPEPAVGSGGGAALVVDLGAQCDGFLTTADGGGSWSLHPPPTVGALAVYSVADWAVVTLPTGVAGESAGTGKGMVEMTSDAGVSWQASPVHGFVYGDADAIVAEMSSPASVWLLVSSFAGSYSRLFVSRDGGEDFVNVSPGA